MRIRTLDKNWDWNFGKGKNDFASDELAIAYSRKTKSRGWLRDCFFAMEDGIDWKNILGSKTSKEDADAAVKKVISTEEGVSRISYFESSLVGRTYTCTARVETIYGKTIEVRI